ncbi:hypothetical protein [Rubritalea tangerina]|uniref:hypothetical protein n=1 Tax=Rubritalea tangerina TaxID=430798 RepID=UPI00361720B2
MTRFSGYRVTGDVKRDRSLALPPVACTHYTVDKGVLKLRLNACHSMRIQKRCFPFIKGASGWKRHV